MLAIRERVILSSSSSFFSFFFFSEGGRRSKGIEKGNLQSVISISRLSFVLSPPPRPQLEYVIQRSMTLLTGDIARIEIIGIILRATDADSIAIGAEEKTV